MKEKGIEDRLTEREALIISNQLFKVFYELINTNTPGEMVIAVISPKGRTEEGIKSVSKI